MTKKWREPISMIQIFSYCHIWFKSTIILFFHHGRKIFVKHQTSPLFLKHTDALCVGTVSHAQFTLAQSLSHCDIHYGSIFLASVTLSTTKDTRASLLARLLSMLSLFFESPPPYVFQLSSSLRHHFRMLQMETLTRQNNACSSDVVFNELCFKTFAYVSGLYMDPAVRQSSFSGQSGCTFLITV